MGNNDKRDMKWRTLSSEYLIRRPWLTARRDTVELPNGTVNDEYYVLEYPDWVNVVAITTGGDFVFVRQYRHGIDEVCHEIVAGVIEPGEQPEAAARRELMEETGFAGHLHICHISTKGALELVCAARDRGLAVSCGATAHHSLLTVDDAAEHGRYLKMNPPLRSVEDRDAIYAGLVDGSVDYVESDHAPHTLEDKEKGASGIPGFAGSLMLLSRLKADGVPTERLVDIFSRNALTLFGLDGEERPLPDRIMWRARKAASEYPFDPFAIPQLG